MAALSVTDIRASGFPNSPVCLLFIIVLEAFPIQGVVTGSMVLDQIILAVDAPRRPRPLVLALVSNIMLLVSTSFTTPCIFVDGDTDPRVLLRAGSVADGNTPRHGFTLILSISGPLHIAVTVSRNLLSNTHCRGTGTVDDFSLVPSGGV